MEAGSELDASRRVEEAGIDPHLAPLNGGKIGQTKTSSKEALA